MSAAAAKADELAAIAAELAEHTPCGFEPCETCTQFVPGDGNPDAEVVFVGEAPGASEDKQGKPFVGQSGRLLSELLESIGMSRDDVYITNIVKARPPGNRDPKPAEVEHHRPWLDRQLAVVEPLLIVPLGRHALQRFVPRAKISELKATRVDHEGRSYFPLLHPAVALYTRERRQELFDDIAKLPGALTNLKG